MSNSDPSSGISVEIRETTAILHFARPTKRNSLSQFTLSRLDEELAQLSTRHDLTTLIFIGSDDAFSSGADLREVSQLTGKAARSFSKWGQSIFQRIADAPQMTVAAINGYCLGGALDLALACDIRVASKNAVFGHPGARLGIITGWGGTQRLPRLIGSARALELFLTATRITSRQALEIGLINQIYDPVLEGALQLSRLTASSDSTIS